MTRGTTPTYTLTLDDDSIDLGLAASVYATFSQSGGKRITKTGDDLDVDGHTVSVYLTQEETLSLLAAKRADIQLNWVYADGSRACSEIVNVAVKPNLLPEVLT